jgi:SAM-dependent methyltransferase
MATPGAFKDHFSGHAGLYTRYRPSYPPALFRALAALAPDLELAWDCGTGNGQAAVALAEHFARVEATDASAKQIEAAAPHPRVHYSVAPAEASGLETGRVSLVTVAQALHWFDFVKFYAEVRRVAKEQALLAASCYELCRITPAVDEIIDAFYRQTLDGYWPPERRHVERAYRDIPFPFTQVELPLFDMRVRWSLEHYLGYMRTWSAVQAYMRKNETDPVADIEAALQTAWGDGEQEIVWPLSLLVGWVS